jgi:FkbM family methyltransferase
MNHSPLPNFIAAPLYSFAKRIIKLYEGYSYTFRKNGEGRLVEQVKDLGFRTVFDVGANVGEWALMMAKNIPTAEIHAFELSSETYKTLVAECSGQSDIYCNNVGLSNESGEIEFKDYGANSGVSTLVTQSTIHDKSDYVLSKASVLTGQEYCASKAIREIDFLKIDVEGAEHLVLKGFEAMLREKKIRLIQFEYGFNNGDLHFLMRDFYQLFESYGYSVGPLKPKGVDFSGWTYDRNLFASGPNYVAVRADDDELISLLSVR